jgi:hypothetical protein
VLTRERSGRRRRRRNGKHERDEERGEVKNRKMKKWEIRRRKRR